jgi:hypothetical protein
MSNWEHYTRTEEEMKELVRDVYDCKIFTSLQCPGHMMGSIFMCSIFMNTPPAFPSLTGNIKLDRKNKLNHITETLKYEEETVKREAYIKNIGMLYEDYSKALPMGVNGYPMFFSVNIASIEEAKRFRDMYGKYETMRGEFEKEWGTEKK